jgi:hypothetical protein
VAAKDNKDGQSPEPIQRVDLKPAVGKLPPLEHGDFLNRSKRAKITLLRASPAG